MIITLPKAPTNNTYYRHSCRSGSLHSYISPKGREWLYSAGWELKRQYKAQKEPVTGLYVVNYTISQDIDAPLKALLDLTEDMGIIENDKQYTFLQVRKEIVKHRIDECIKIEFI